LIEQLLTAGIFSGPQRQSARWRSVGGISKTIGGMTSSWMFDPFFYFIPADVACC